MSNTLSITNYLLKGYREEEKKRNDLGGLDFGHFFLSAINSSNNSLNFINNLEHNKNISNSQNLNNLENIKTFNETFNENNYNFKFNSSNNEIVLNTDNDKFRYYNINNQNINNQNIYNSPDNFENRIDKINNKVHSSEYSKDSEKTNSKKIEENTKNTLFENYKLNENINKIDINNNSNTSKDENKIIISKLNKEQIDNKFIREINVLNKNNNKNLTNIFNNLLFIKKENINNSESKKSDSSIDSKNFINQLSKKNNSKNIFINLSTNNNLDKMDKLINNQKEEAKNTNKIKNNLNEFFNIDNLSKKEKDQIKEELMELNRNNAKKTSQKEINNNKKEENIEKKEINKNNFENLNQNILYNKNKGDINKTEFNKDEFSKFFIKELKWNLSLNEKNYLNTLNSVKWDINGNSYILKIDLYPENLGKIEVIINKNNDILTGKILAESSIVGDKIKENIELIINNLAENGINISSFNISSSTYQKGNEKYETMKNELEINKISSSLRNEKNGNDSNLFLNNKNSNSNISYYSDLYIGRRVNIKI